MSKKFDAIFILYYFSILSIELRGTQEFFLVTNIFIHRFSQNFSSTAGDSPCSAHNAPPDKDYHRQSSLSVFQSILLLWCV